MTLFGKKLWAKADEPLFRFVYIGPAVLQIIITSLGNDTMTVDFKQSRSM